MTAAPPIMDIQDRGIGDIVLASWLVASAKAAGQTLSVNPRSHGELALALGIPETYLTRSDGPSWTNTDGIGLKFEYERLRAGDTRCRFELWAASLGLFDLNPVRPVVALTKDVYDWAEAEWIASTSEARPGRVAILPQAAWPVRQWPMAYFLDLADLLEERGFSVVLLGSKPQDMSRHGRRWYAGFDLVRTAAMLSLADLVVANDSGPAHLGGVVGTQTIAICGPTLGKVVFAHDRNIHPFALGNDVLACVGCHFNEDRGYRQACRSGGCRALFLNTPEKVISAVDRLEPDGISPEILAAR
jgi:hypothetical protein